jgi:hypothetical protein
MWRTSQHGQRTEYGHPIRCAITVEGICGYDASSSRIRGSNASATDPFGGRWYLGGPSLASVAFTVFREIPQHPGAIRAIGICSARRNRRISAQPPRSAPAPSRPGYSQDLGEAGQIRLGAQWSVFTCRR